jgi:hypothetical protein
MQHALALNLSTVATDLPVTSDHLDLPKQCRTSIIDGFRIDKHTGEIYGQLVISTLQVNIEQYRSGIPRPPASPSQYLHLMDVRKSDNVVYVDFGGPTPAKPTTVIDVLSPKPKRGPKPNVCLNPFAAIIKQAIIENAHWIENAVMAGMYISVGSNNGKLNIRPSYVRKVITMAVISTDAIEGNTVFRNHDFEPVKDRYVRYLAAAGRVALQNIERYLNAHPSEQLRLELKVLEPKTGEEADDMDEADYLMDETDDLECRIELKNNYGRI